MKSGYQEALSFVSKSFNMIKHITKRVYESLRDKCLKIQKSVLKSLEIVFLHIKTAFRLSKNDIKSRHADSFLGILWSFLMPLVTILVFWFVFQKGFKNPPVNNATYILWFSVAYIPWIFITDVISTGCNCLVEYSYLVKKIKFNVYIIPPVKLLSAIKIHLFFVAFLIFMSFVCGCSISIHILQVIFYTFAASFFSLGLIYLLSSLTVFFKDIVSIVNIFIQIGFWITPIMWNEESLTDVNVKKIVALNPAHYIIVGYRDSLINHRWFWERGSESIYFFGISTVIFLLGIMIFKKLSPYFADEV